MDSRKIQVLEFEQGERLDLFLAKKFPEELSRSRIKEWILTGAVSVNGRTVKPHYAVRTGDQITMEVTEPPGSDAQGENIPLEILHEDADLIVINKPAGMVVHPAAGNFEHTLVNALVYHTRNELSQVGGTSRPGIVHRLDKNTSGVLVVAKNDLAHRYLAKQFKTHTIHRVYEALVKGVIQHDELRCGEAVGRAFLNRKKVMVKPSGGKDALTHFRVLGRFRQGTHVEARPQTGRTHQIRVHLSYLGHPVLGDDLYGGASTWIERHALHAKELGFVHPRTKEEMCFTSSLPEDMEKLLKLLREGK